MALEACERCDGLNPAGRRACLHCEQPLRSEAPVGRRWRGARLAARLMGASAALVTLMACYGMIARPHDGMDGFDRDGDGSRTGADCDDARGDVYPGAQDRDGDGVDQNCDGVDGWRDPTIEQAALPIATDPEAGGAVMATEPAATPAIATDPAAPPGPAPSPKVIATDPP